MEELCMISKRKGKVLEIIYDDEDIQEIIVNLQTTRAKAINFRRITGSVMEGDIVILNTTAVELNLGTGGWHFVMNIPGGSDTMGETRQHIMKLRYTPFQLATGSCEEQGSPYHDSLKNACSIDGMPVLVGELHSMLPIAATYIKQKSTKTRLVYIMTDKAALPLYLSRNVRLLKRKGFLDGTISVGQSFGGDLEAVNIYSGLVAARTIMKADLVIVCMGPGITGTATQLGFSGMDQTEVLHAAFTLGGIPVLIPRISFMEQRRRHYGLSHHTRTVLDHTLAAVHLPILEQFKAYCAPGIHHWHFGNIDRVKNLKNLLQQYPEPILTMGRTMEEDPYFFHSVALAADFGLFLTTGASDLNDAVNLSHKWRAWTIP
jgi:hypothetical protein